ncbi:hypothetical protein [Actinoplanes sp. HUAS TT8]|uniref:hypothetical protein n=1 Tax=Actinoplanes sp. HUAS TT8 TaxID=3447453 RepID=UPI003F51D506
MYWWKRQPGEREQWTLDPLVAVGPLRFGMSPAQVEAVLDERASGSQGDEHRWEHYHEQGIVAFYTRAGLAGVRVEAMNGPLLRLGDVELIARVPSEVRADLHALAGAELPRNWSGDPEAPAWGLSMGTTQEWAHSPTGQVERRDAVITHALLVGPESAADPYHAAPVVMWRNIDDLEPNPGAWPVTPDADRPRWDWEPLKRVGPLHFGMSPVQVSAALDGESPAGRRGHHPWPILEEPGQWTVQEERFDRAGVVAHYWQTWGVPTLGAVTVRGRTGPQISYAEMPLIGGRVSALDAFLTRHAIDHDLELRIGCNGDTGVGDLNLYLRAARAGDTVVSEARFGAPDWEDHG